jgi:Fe2+ transport system protein FeoA
MVQLSKLSINQHAVIVDILTNEIERNRLISMGFVLGGKVKVIRKHYNGYMIHCRINSTEFAIREKTANDILVRI